MKILVTGATGFVGKALCNSLIDAGHDLVIVTRDPSRARLKLPASFGILTWEEVLNASASPEAEAQLTGLEAVIHLAGEPLVGKRWTHEYQEKLWNSRVTTSKQLISSLESLDTVKPKVFLTASAIGYYGDRGNEVLDESSSPGNDFLAKLCQSWEAALFESSLSGVRKAALRFGIILGKEGGALEKMLLPFSLGVGFTIAGGNQWMSWIHLDDLVSAILDCLKDPALEGPVNCCSPNPVTNKEFAQTLAGLMGDIKLLDIPRFALKMGLGESATALLSSQKVIPSKLNKLGFQFRYPEIEKALYSIVK